MEYIKISRDINKHWLWSDAVKLQWWLDLLLLASWESHKVLHDSHLITLEKGQFIASIAFLSERWEKSAHTIIKFLKLLEEENMIYRETVHRQTSIITICNYASYQITDDADVHTIMHTQVHNQVHTQVHTQEERKKENSPHTPYKEKNKEDFTENQRFSTHKNVRVCVCEGQDGISGQEEVKAPPKAPLIDKRREEFRKAITPYEEKYGKEMCENFFNYWSEYNRSRTKMRCELQKTWQLSGRLATWAKNDYRVNQPSTVYGNTTNSRYSSADIAERERLERQRSAYRLMQRLAAEDGGDPLPPLEQ